MAAAHPDLFELRRNEDGRRGADTLVARAAEELGSGSGGDDGGGGGGAGGGVKGKRREICQYMASKNGCGRGSRCQFSHDAPTVGADGHLTHKQLSRAAREKPAAAAGAPVAAAPAAAAAAAAAAPSSGVGPLSPRDAALRVHAAIVRLPGRLVGAVAYRGALEGDPAGAAVSAAVASIEELAAVHGDLLRCERVRGAGVIVHAL
jgi:hypothetical protein